MNVYFSGNTKEIQIHSIDVFTHLTSVVLAICCGTIMVSVTCLGSITVLVTCFGSMIVLVTCLACMKHAQ